MALIVRNDPEVLDKFKDFMTKYNESQIQERGSSNQGQLVTAFFMAAEKEGKSNVTPKMVASIALEEFKLDIAPNRVAGILASLGFNTVRRRVGGGKQSRFYIWEDATMKVIRERYVSEHDDFKELFERSTDLFQP